MRNKRQDIVDAALSLFRDNGFHAVGIDRVIAESGVAKMTMYKYFSSKNALIEAVLRERDERFRESLSAFLQREPKGRERVRAVFRWHEQWLKEPSFHGCMFINAAAEFPGVASSIVLTAAQHKWAMRLLIQETLDDVVPCDRIPPLANHLMLLLDGAIVAAQIGDAAAIGNAWQAAEQLLRQADPSGASKASTAARTTRAAWR